MTERLQAALAEFEATARPAHDYAWAHTHMGEKHAYHVAFGSMIHGDEVGSLPAVNRIVGELVRGELSYGGIATFFVGNPEAGLAGRRFLESDLNRTFYAQKGEDHEHRRARALMPLLDRCDLFVDFHQTILETKQSFYIFPFHDAGWRWARALGAAKAWVTRSPDAPFSVSGACADEYVRGQGKPGLTVELSQRGFSAAAEETCYRAMRDVLAFADRIAAGGATLAELADQRPELGFYQTVHREIFVDPAMALRPGWTNFAGVNAGEVVSAPSGPAIVAPEPGMVLFPKYPPRAPDGLAKGPLPGEIYRIIQEMPVHPQIAYAKKAPGA
jgi:succinylglutamate desuccinylase